MCSESVTYSKKYLIFHFREAILLIHLGMTGKLLVKKKVNNKLFKSFKYRQAACVALTGSRLSSKYQFRFNQYCFPVAYTNCHIPDAFALLYAFGFNPDSIMAKYINSSGNSCSFKMGRIKSLY